jgi:hypothetical protein
MVWLIWLLWLVNCKRKNIYSIIHFEFFYNRRRCMIGLKEMTFVDETISGTTSCINGNHS